MVTIDTHTHLGGFDSVAEIAELLSTREGVARWRTERPDIYEEVKNTIPTDNSDDLITAMDKHSIDLSIVQPTVGVSNAQVIEMVRRHPSRFIPLAWAAEFSWVGRWDESEDPGFSADNSARIARKASEALSSQGFAGIGETCARDVTKQVDPVLIARDFTPLMEVLAEHRKPIQFPTGWTQFPGNLFYQDPLWIDELAGRFPGVPIVLTKMGRGIQRFFDSAIAVALRNRNVHLDLVASTPDHVKKAIELIGPDRIMFGTDWSYTWRYLSSPYDVHSASRTVLEAATQDMHAQEAILDTTARRVFASGVEAMSV